MANMKCRWCERGVRRDDGAIEFACEVDGRIAYPTMAPLPPGAPRPKLEFIKLTPEWFTEAPDEGPPSPRPRPGWLSAIAYVAHYTCGPDWTYWIALDRLSDPDLLDHLRRKPWWSAACDETLARAISAYVQRARAGR